MESPVRNRLTVTGARSGFVSLMIGGHWLGLGWSMTQTVDLWVMSVSDEYGVNTGPKPTRAIPTSSGIHRLRVRYAECDPMNVAHHASYTPLLEMGRTNIARGRVSYAGWSAGCSGGDEAGASVSPGRFCTTMMIEVCCAAVHPAGSRSVIRTIVLVVERMGQGASAASDPAMCRWTACAVATSEGGLRGPGWASKAVELARTRRGRGRLSRRRDDGSDILYGVHGNRAGRISVMGQRSGA